MKRLKAFSLSEVLLTLTIIGIIALLTMPFLKKVYQRHTTVAMLKKAYYTLESSLDSAIAKDVSIDFSDMPESEIFRNIILPCFNVTKDCGADKAGCFANDIKDFDGNSIDIDISDSVLLSSGFSVGNTGMDYYVDINGPMSLIALAAISFIIDWNI